MKNEYYISNHTDTTFDVEMDVRYPELIDLRQGPVLEVTPNRARQELPSTLMFEVIDQKVLFTLPAKTTVFLGFSTGGTCSSLR